jgi:putative membrane protein
MREPGTEDATRRTRLANERTYLAWWRTGLTALAVSVGVGRLVPGLSGGTKWPYEILGAGFGVLGLAFMWLGHTRARAVEDALDRGGFAPLPVRMALGLALAGIVLGVALIVVLLVAN